MTLKNLWCLEIFYPLNNIFIYNKEKSTSARPHKNYYKNRNGKKYHFRDFPFVESRRVGKFLGLHFCFVANQIVFPREKCSLFIKDIKKNDLLPSARK